MLKEKALVIYKQKPAVVREITRDAGKIDKITVEFAEGKATADLRCRGSSSFFPRVAPPARVPGAVFQPLPLTAN
jgi:hypothetical protein